MMRHRTEQRRPEHVPDSAYQYADCSILVPIASPPSWVSTYFYVVNHATELLEPFEPLRCISLNEREVRRSTREIRLGEPFGLSLYVSACPALDTPGEYVLPWEIRVGATTAASLHPPPWVALASEIGQGSVSRAVLQVMPEALSAQRELRRRQVEKAMRSAALLDDIRHVRGRRMRVQWFEEDQSVWREDDLASGAELFDALIDPSTRNRAHLIHFPDGWYVDGLDWLT
jgi:hypothetical protein